MVTVRGRFSCGMRRQEVLQLTVSTCGTCDEEHDFAPSCVLPVLLELPSFKETVEVSGTDGVKGIVVKPQFYPGKRSLTPFSFFESESSTPLPRE